MTFTRETNKESTNAQKPGMLSERRNGRNKKVRAQVDRRLVGYALTATAAGVGTLALAAPAKADIIYTPANTSILPGRTSPSLVPLDLNHDGITDFTFTNLRSSSGAGAFLGVYGAQNANKIIEGAGSLLAAALPAGARIGPGAPFLFNAQEMAAASYKTFPPAYGGSWINVTNRYLGLEFIIAGQEYFGWARLDVSQSGGFNAALTGYAYDTVPNQGLLAGQTSTPEPGTLGLLALGSLGLGYWRRRIAVGSQH